MPDKDASTPRVFLIRHGETEWSQSGRHTGRTEVPLTANGEEQVQAIGEIVYGKGKLIDPTKLAKVWVSPRERTKRTYELLTGESNGYEVRHEVEEWVYGAYEGLLTKEIRSKRQDAGLDSERNWNIWKDGCEDGESPSEVAARIDKLIEQIKELQRPHMNDTEPKDVLIIAHGHFTRVFAKRWIGLEIGFPLRLMMSPAGVCTLSYEHHSVDEPALNVGAGFPS